MPAMARGCRARRTCLASAALGLTLGLTLNACAAGLPRRSVSGGAPPSVLNVAHRGASGRAPEHTIAAYDLALTSGADYIEQDLQLTKDGILVVLHDPTLDRTARGPAEHCTGLVIEKTLAQIRTCDVGGWFNSAQPQHARAEYEGLRIPTLDEVFARYGHRANYYIETKNPESSPGMEEKLIALLDAHDLRRAAVDRWAVLIQSFSTASLRKLHALDPALPLIQLYGAPTNTSAAVRAVLDSVSPFVVGIGPNAGAVDAALSGAARARCLEIHPYTVNETTDMQALISAGASGMFTNFPDRLRTLSHGGARDGAPAAGRRALDAHVQCRAERRARQAR